MKITAAAFLVTSLAAQQAAAVRPQEPTMQRLYTDRSGRRPGVVAATGSAARLTQITNVLIPRSVASTGVASTLVHSALTMALTSPGSPAETSSANGML